MESRGSVLTQSSLDQGSSTGMFIHEFSHVMDEATNNNQATVLLLVSLIDVLFPGENGKVVGILGPYNITKVLAKFLQFHAILTLSNLVVGKSLQFGSEAKEVSAGNEPFGRIVLVPSDGIPIVLRELMMAERVKQLF